MNTRANILRRSALLLVIIMMALFVLWPGGGTTAFYQCEATYKAKCAACHAADGSGKTVQGKQLKVRDVRSPEVQKMSDEKMLEVILKGKGKMPAYEQMLGKKMCGEMVTYMRDLAKKK